MFQPLRLRTVHIDAAKLAGEWVWASTVHQRWQLNISALDEQKISDMEAWVLVDAQGQALAWFYPAEFCRWLNLQQLMVLNPSAAMRAAVIALIRHDAAELLGVDASASVSIVADDADRADQRNCAMNVVIHTEHHEDRAHAASALRVRISRHILMQHMSKGQLRPQSELVIADHPYASLVDVSATAMVGDLALQADDIANLELGSLMLLSGSYVQDGILHLKVRNTILSVTEDHNTSQWTVLEISTHEVTQPPLAETYGSEGQEEADANMNLNDIPLNITVQLAGVRINAADLTRLQAGAVISLQMPANALVDLVCNDKTIAQGELVDLDGTLAVAITKMQVSQ